jgi:hypothetical protein
MPSFSQSSKDKLAEASEDLQVLFNEVIKYFDCTIVCSHRNKEDQTKAYNDGFSDVQYPNSYHNKFPAMAIDAVPYPELYTDEDKMIEFGGFVMGIYSILKAEDKIKGTIEWGWQLWGWDKPHFQNKI